MSDEGGRLDNDQKFGAVVVGLFLFGVSTALLVDAFGGKEIGFGQASWTKAARRTSATPCSATTSYRSRSCRCSSSPRSSAPWSWRGGIEGDVTLNYFLILSAFLFCTGIYGVLARRNGVLVLMSVELMLNAVNINLIAFSAFTHTSPGRCSRCS